MPNHTASKRLPWIDSSVRLSPSVNVGPICQDLFAANRRMAVNNVFAKIFVAFEKFLGSSAAHRKA
jgi:hypothetical protein